MRSVCSSPRLCFATSDLYSGDWKHPTRGAEFALYVLTEYEQAIEEGMDRLAVPPTEGALAATRAGLRKAI